MRLWLVRHGATVNNAEARFTGQTDIELSAIGQLQVEALTARLANTSFDAIVASDLLRARQTALPIAAACGLSVVWDRRLREIAMGEWEGRTLEDVRSQNAERFALWQSAPADCPPPGGEALRTVRSRVVDALDACYERHPYGEVLWVTHGGVLSVLVAHVLGMELTVDGRLRRDNAAISQVCVSDSGMQIALWNNTMHLSETTSRIEGRQVM